MGSTIAELYRAENDRLIVMRSSENTNAGAKPSILELVAAPDGTRLAVHVFETTAVHSPQQLLLLHANGFSGLCYTELVRFLMRGILGPARIT
jgi:hypothetical protein